MGLYIVRRDGWYSERTVWGIAGVFILAGTLLAWQVHELWVLLITATGVCSLITAFSGFDVMSTLLVNLGFQPRLGDVLRAGNGAKVYRMRTDSWYLERGIYLVVGTTQTVSSVLAVVHSPWWLAFTGFVGAMSLGFAWSGFCPVANVLYFAGLEPRLLPPAAVRPSEAQPEGALQPAK